MSKKNFLEKLNDILSPFAYKLANQRHLKAISSGMFFSLPFMVIGAFFLIIANPPINMDNFDFNNANFLLKFLALWKNWAVQNYDAITLPYNLTFGLIGILSVFGIAYSLAKIYKLDAATNGLIAIVSYLLVCTKVVEGKIDTEFLGSNGLFIAIIIGLISVELTRVFEKNNFKIKLPDTVPIL